jgi:hypothetical protein
LLNVSYSIPESHLEPAIKPSLESEPYYSSTQPFTFIKPSLESEPYYSSTQPFSFIKPSGSIRQVIRGYISCLIAMLSRGAHIIEMYDDNLYGMVVRITTDLSAKEALELWLKLIDYLSHENYRIVLSVKWLGENNVCGDELIDYIAKIMIKSGIGPKALPGFDSVRILREIRE